MDRTIGRLAKAAGVPVSTVRYYERRGLLPPVARTTSGYRLYSDQDLDRLMFIRSAQAAGFTLEDIAALMDFRDGTVQPCREVQVLIEDRLARVAEEISRLRHVQGMLKEWFSACRESERTGQCSVLEGLASGTRTAPHRQKKQQKT